MKNNNNQEENNLSPAYDPRESQAQELEMSIETTYKLTDEQMNFLKNSGLEGIVITDQSLEVIDSALDEDLKINILRSPALVEEYDEIKNLDINVIKAIVAEGTTEISSIDIDEDSAETANNQIASLENSEMDNKKREEEEDLEEQEKSFKH